MSVNVASVPNQVTIGDAVPGLVTTQANMVVIKCPPPLVCQVARPGAITSVGVEQEAVPEKVSTAVAEAVLEEDLEVMTSRSPTEAEAASVQEAVTPEEWPAHAAPVYVIVCAPAIEAADSRTMVMNVFIVHSSCRN